MKNTPLLFLMLTLFLGLLFLIPTPLDAQDECHDAGCTCLSDRIIGDECLPPREIRYDLECFYAPGSPERSCCCPSSVPPPTCTESGCICVRLGSPCPAGYGPGAFDCPPDGFVDKECCCPIGGGNGNGNGNGDTGSPGGWGTIDLLPPITATSFEEIISSVIKFVFQIALVVAPLMIIVGGALFVTAGGNLERIAQAKKIMMWTVVGFLIVLLARGIVDLIGEILGTP